MKKSTFFIILVFLSTNIFGQINKFDYGIELSPNISSLRGNSILFHYNKPILGYSFGAFTQINISKHFSFRTNITFETKGSTGSYVVNDLQGNYFDKITEKISYKYLTLPLLLKTTIGNKVKYFINIGPFLSYLVRIDFLDYGDKITKRKEKSILPKNNPYDYGITSGIGLIINLNNNHIISLEIRNNLGLYNITVHPEITHGIIKTNSTNLLISYSLSKQK